MFATGAEQFYEKGTTFSSTDLQIRNKLYYTIEVECASEDRRSTGSQCSTVKKDLFVE